MKNADLPDKKGICKATQISLCRGRIIYGNAEQNIWKEISEHEVVHFWTGKEEHRKNVCAWRKRTIGHTTVNEKAIKIRKKATCCISPSIKETTHPSRFKTSLLLQKSTYYLNILSYLRQLVTFFPLNWKKILNFLKLKS